MSSEKNSEENKENKEKINASLLLSSFHILNKSAFKCYLREIWAEISREENEKFVGIGRLGFAKYYRLPGIISLRLFSQFAKKNRQFIGLNEFISNMCILFTAGYEEKAKFIFDFYDFDRDGEITKEDIRIVLSYVPLIKKKRKKKKKRKIRQCS